MVVIAMWDNSRKDKKVKLELDDRLAKKRRDERSGALGAWYVLGLHGLVPD